jgi:hypothetical protein
MKPRNIEIKSYLGTEDDPLNIIIGENGITIETDPQTYGANARPSRRVALNFGQWEIIKAEMERFERILAQVNETPRLSLAAE